MTAQTERLIMGAIESQFDIHAMEPEDFARMWLEISDALKPYALMVEALVALKQEARLPQGVAQRSGRVVLPASVYHNACTALAAVARQGGDVKQAPAESPQSGDAKQRNAQTQPGTDHAD